MAIDAVTVLNVDPGAYSSAHACGSSGLLLSSSSSDRAACAFLTLWLTRRFGSYVGFEYAASTPPLRTSSTTTEPGRPASPSAASCCTARDSVSTTVPTGWRVANTSARLLV